MCRPRYAGSSAAVERLLKIPHRLFMPGNFMGVCLDVYPPGRLLTSVITVSYSQDLEGCLLQATCTHLTTLKGMLPFHSAQWHTVESDLV